MGVLKKILMSGQALLIWGAVFASLSVIFTLIGSNKSVDENTDRINLINESSKQDLKEAFGILSNRTVEQYLADKTPSYMSLDEAKDLVERAVTKWEDDTIVKGLNRPFAKWDTAESREVFSNSKIGGDIFCYRNDKSDADNSKVIFDTRTEDEIAGPDLKQYWVHVLFNTKSKQEEYDVHMMDLWLKYCKWYLKKTGTISAGMNWHQHVFLVIVDNWDMSKITQGAGSGLLDAYRDSQGRAGFEDQYQLIFYNKNELKNMKSRRPPNLKGQS